jgi:hypothetical protein
MDLADEVPRSEDACLAGAGSAAANLRRRDRGRRRKDDRATGPAPAIGRVPDAIARGEGDTFPTSHVSRVPCPLSRGRMRFNRLGRPWRSQRTQYRAPRIV